MPSAMKREYAAQPKGGKLKRSMFDLGRRHLTTLNGGYLVPVFWGWLFPGDVIRGAYTAFLRMSSSLEFPLFDNFKLTIHTYFCPIRQLWDNFPKFMGEQVDPGDSTSYTLPEVGNSTTDTSVVTAAGFSRLMRYLGVPVVAAGAGGVAEEDIGAVPFRAYCHIYNWHYRDQNQQDSAVFNTGDGPDGAYHSVYTLKKRGKRHDRFTSLLSAPQKGDNVPVSMDVRSAGSPGGQPTIMRESNEAYHLLDADAATVDMSGSTGTAAAALHTELVINDLRNAAAIQQFLERDNRYGTRYDEIIYSHYGVEYNAERIAPVYLGGGSGYIQTTTIPNQSGTGTLGDLAAIATGTLQGGNFTYAVDEPGIYMSIASVSADLSYSQGLEKKHRYRTRYDLFWPEFVGIGDQAVETAEIYYQNNATDDVVFGYEPRYEELRTEVNRTSQEFDVDDLLTLEVMHLQEDLGSAPVLGDTWIQDQTPYARIQRVTTQDHFLADFYMDCKIARALPVNGVPGIGRL